MRNTNTFSILFWTDKKNMRGGQALLYARITVDGKRVNLSLKRKIDISIWDATKKSAKGTSSEARQINLYLDQTHTQLFQCYQDLKFKGE
ncbi:Arm DNA-binding domain-containing protein [Confluentibacter sediminis]|uniref:Arm DNA-binding domain-containing protein n=1 Tax=Confluentibacter sediminis TaxID=2219045 RepID=UPI000DAD3FC7|nr:Arm DNA-binding domain-containing protein [Confluentibacter sediminis]